MIKFWTYSKEYKNLRKKILRSIDGTLKSGDIFYGNELKKFENRPLKFLTFLPMAQYWAKV